MKPPRRFLLAFALTAAILLACGQSSKAQAAPQTIDSIQAQITLPSAWVLDASSLPDSAAPDINNPSEAVFRATRSNGSNTLTFSIIADINPSDDPSLPDNLELYDAAQLQETITSIEKNLRGGRVTPLATENSVALCWEAKDEKNQKYFVAYLRHNAKDIYAIEFSPTGRGLMAREYQEFQKIVSSIAFQEDGMPEFPPTQAQASSSPATGAQTPSTTPAPKAGGANRLQDGASNARDRAQEADSRTRATRPPEPESYVAPYLSSTRAFMDALRTDLIASEFGDISVKHAATTALKDGRCTVEYRMRYAGYYATALFECAPYGSIQSVDFRFPCGRSYLEDFDYRFDYDVMIMMAACGGFLQNGVDDTLLLLMSDIYEDILTAMQGWGTEEWIWQNGYGFLATYEPGTREAVLTIRVEEPMAL